MSKKGKKNKEKNIFKILEGDIKNKKFLESYYITFNKRKGEKVYKLKCTNNDIVYPDSVKGTVPVKLMDDGNKVTIVGDSYVGVLEYHELYELILLLQSYLKNEDNFCGEFKIKKVK